MIFLPGCLLLNEAINSPSSRGYPKKEGELRCKLRRHDFLSAGFFSRRGQ